MQILLSVYAFLCALQRRSQQGAKEQSPHPDFGAALPPDGFCPDHGRQAVAYSLPISKRRILTMGNCLSRLIGSHGVRHGFKTGGGPKPLLNMKVSRSLILIYIKLYKILIHAFKY